MPENSRPLSTTVWFWDGPWHGTTEEIEGRPSYISFDQMEEDLLDSIKPIEMIAPIGFRTRRYKRAAQSTLNPNLWRYDYVGEGF